MMTSIQKKIWEVCLLLALTTVMTGCSSEGTSQSEQAAPPVSLQADLSQNLAIPDNQNKKQYRILLFGNSHVAGLDTVLQQLISNSDPNVDVVAHTFGGGFLDNPKSKDNRDKELLKQNWTHVILQGQKYSQSGTVIYPTRHTQQWIAKAKQLGITPILFPEHPQKNNNQEGRYIHQLHEEIVSLQSSCLAPVGLTWDKVISNHPEIKLHSADGNHANSVGMELTAMVFYPVITGQPLDSLKTQSGLQASPEQQTIFRNLAMETLTEHMPCQN